MPLIRASPALLTSSPAGDAGGRSPDRRIVVIKRLDQLRDVAFAERRPRHCPDGIDRLGTDLGVLIVDRFQQRVDDLGRRRPRLERETPHLERSSRLARVANLNDTA